MTNPDPSVAAARAAEQRLTVPVPGRFLTASGYQVDVREVLERGDRDRVMWYEIAAMAEALLRAADAVGEPSEDQWQAAAAAYESVFEVTIDSFDDGSSMRPIRIQSLKAAAPHLFAAQAQEVARLEAALGRIVSQHAAELTALRQQLAEEHGLPGWWPLSNDDMPDREWTNIEHLRNQLWLANDAAAQTEQQLAESREHAIAMAEQATVMVTPADLAEAVRSAREAALAAMDEVHDAALLLDLVLDKAEAEKARLLRGNS